MNHTPIISTADWAAALSDQFGLFASLDRASKVLYYEGGCAFCGGEFCGVKLALQDSFSQCTLKQARQSGDLPLNGHWLVVVLSQTFSSAYAPQLTTSQTVKLIAATALFQQQDQQAESCSPGKAITQAKSFKMHTNRRPREVVQMHRDVAESHGMLSVTFTHLHLLLWFDTPWLKVIH